MPSSAAKAAQSAPQPRTLQDLLDQEERRAWQGLTTSAEHLCDELCEASGVRRHVRAHPYLTLGAAAAAGFLAAPLAGSLVCRLLPSALKLLSRTAQAVPTQGATDLAFAHGLRTIVKLSARA